MTPLDELQVRGGGPAHPFIATIKSSPGGAPIESRIFAGMTLRDHFAAHALTGILAAHTSGDITSREAARHAYAFADAMLEARK